MRWRRLLLTAIGLGAVVAVIATITVNVLLPWSVEILVPDFPKEQLAASNPTELNDKLLSGALHLKSVRGMDKAIYLFTEAPMFLVRSWAYFFVSSVVAAFLGGLLINARSAA